MVVGLTGGIGSGKSTVLARFALVDNIAVYCADIEAKKLMNTSGVIRQHITALFGDQAYKDGVLNTAFIGSIVFGNKEQLKQLNAIVHPEVYKHLKAFIKKNEDKDYIVYENAILFENKSDNFCDVIITVLADEDKRIARVVSRDNIAATDVIKRMNNQWDDAKKVLLSNYIVHNNDLNTLESQIIKIHNNLTKNKL